MFCVRVFQVAGKNQFIQLAHPNGGVMSTISAPDIRKSAVGILSASVFLIFAGHAAAVDRTVVAKNGMVVAGHPLAVESGIRALRAGGTACDAAIATAATLSVM